MWPTDDSGDQLDRARVPARVLRFATGNLGDHFPLAHVRVHGDLASVRDAYVRVVESQHHHFVRGLFTFDEWTDNALLRERLLAGVASAAAGLVLVLACLGIYGMLARAVMSRTREIGVRAALGATQRRIVGMVARDGLMVIRSNTATTAHRSGCVSPTAGNNPKALTGECGQATSASTQLLRFDEVVRNP